MAKNYRTNIQLNGLQLLNAAMQPSGTAPSAISAGQIYYNTSGSLYFSTGAGTGSWVQLATGTSALASLNGLTVATTLAGTANQITVTTLSPNITLSFPTAGVTLPGKTTLTASSSTAASLNIPFGSAPSAPVNGDVWIVQATGVQAQYGGTPATHTLVDLDSAQTLTTKTLTTPAINGATLSGTLSGAYTISGVATFSASPVIATITNTGTLTLPTSSDTLVGRATVDTFTNKTFDTAGTGNVFKINGTQISAITGTGSVVLATSPSLTTPSLGAATATSINGLTITSSTGTLTIPNTVAFALSGANNLTLTTTGITTVTLPTSGTLVNTAVTSLTSLGTVSTSLTGYVSSTAGVLSAASTIPGTAVSGNISGNAANVTGTVALANGGTNTSLTAVAGGIVWSNATQLQISTAGTAGYVLTSAGTSAPTWTQATSTNVNSAIVQRDASGNISVSQVTVSADPVQALQVATKQYVDNFKSGFNLHTAAEAASTVDVGGTYVAGGGSATSVTGTSGTNTLTVTTPGFNLAIGQLVAGTGLTGLVQVTDVSGTGPYTVTLSSNLSTTASGTYTFLDSNGGTGVGATLTGTNVVFTIDNYTPDLNDRILIKNQTVATQNGVYVITQLGVASTTPWILTRASDYDNGGNQEVLSGDLIYIATNPSEFSITPVNQNTSWVMNAQGTGTGQSIKIGTDSVTFVQFSGGSSVTAGAGTSVVGNSVSIALGSSFDTTSGTGTSGLSLTGNTLQVRLNPAGGLTSATTGMAVQLGTGLVISGNAVSYATGTTTQTGSGVTGGAYSYATQKQIATITGNSSLTSFAINHNLNSQDVNVQVYQTSVGPDTPQYGEVEVDIVRTSTSVVTVSFAVAPATGVTYNVVIVG